MRAAFLFRLIIRAAISCCRNRRTRYIDNFVPSTTSSSERPCSSILRARSTCWCGVLNVLAKWATVLKAGKFSNLLQTSAVCFCRREPTLSSPELTASAPVRRLGTRRDVIDLSNEHSRRKWLNSHAVCYLRSLPGSYARAIYAGNRVQVNSAHTRLSSLTKA
jgi:hypothetical protein